MTKKNEGVGSKVESTPRWQEAQRDLQKAMENSRTIKKLEHEEASWSEGFWEHEMKSGSAETFPCIMKATGKVERLNCVQQGLFQI